MRVTLQGHLSHDTVIGWIKWWAGHFPQLLCWLPVRDGPPPLESCLLSPADLESRSVRSATTLQPADDMLLWSGSGPKLDYAASLRSSSCRFDYIRPLTQHPHCCYPNADETRWGGPSLWYSTPNVSPSACHLPDYFRRTQTSLSLPGQLGGQRIAVDLYRWTKTR